MNNKQVAHAFVIGAASGRATNLYISDSRLYSYGQHYCLAAWGDDSRWISGKTLFVACRPYSVTTAHHRSLVCAAACKERVRIVDVYDPAAPVAENLRWYDEQEAALQQRITRARTESNRNFYTEELERLKRDRAIYESFTH